MNAFNRESSDAIASQLLDAIDRGRAPEPGFYRNIPDYEYHGIWRVLSNSLLQEMKRSPLHAYHAMSAPSDDPTPAMQLGTAVHAAILQPDFFSSNFVALPKVDKRTKAGLGELTRFMHEHTGKRFLSPADFARCNAMRDAALQVQKIRDFLGGEGDFELSFVWRDPSELLFKGRADRVSWEYAGGTIVDIKTCPDARRDAFERKIFSLGYHNQGALYAEGLLALGMSIKHYTIIAIESEAPHGIAIYRIRDEVLAAAHKENQKLKHRFEECMKSNCWPSYGERVVDIGLPQWVMNQLEGTQ